MIFLKHIHTKNLWAGAALILTIFLIGSIAHAAQVTLAWDPNDPDPNGYHVYQRTELTTYDYSAPVWSGTDTTCTIDDLNVNTPYFFVVRAYSESEQSSDSNEVEYMATITDSDGDGFVDEEDAFPFDENEWLDFDGDGIGDNADLDDDNDGMPDLWEMQFGLDPLANDALLDFDNDGHTNLDEYTQGMNPTLPDVTEGIIIDDGESGTSYSGNWRPSSYVDPYGTQSLYSRDVGATYSYEAALSGSYEVSIWWTQGSNRYANVPVHIYDGQTLLETIYVDQRQGGGQWNFLGTYEFTGVGRVEVVSQSSESSTGADATSFTRVIPEIELIIIDDGESGTSSSGNWRPSGYPDPYGTQSLYSRDVGAIYSYETALSGSYEVSIWWTQGPNRYTNVPIRIYDGQTLLETIYVNQRQGGGQWNILGTYQFADTVRVEVVSQSSANSTGADATSFTRAIPENELVIIDDGESGTSSSGNWRPSGYPDPYGTQSLYSRDVDATYSYETALSGSYEVSIWWTQGPNRYANVPIRIYDGQTLLETIHVDQRQNGGQWNILGTYEFTGSARVVVVSQSSSNSTGADAVQYGN